MAYARNSQIVGNWIGLVRTRLAAHRGEKPTTKAAQIRALWPEIEAALRGGHSTTFFALGFGEQFNTGALCASD